jgi:hypothetical protein
VSETDDEEAAMQAALDAVPDEQWAEIAAALEEVLAEPEHLHWDGGYQVGTTVVDGVEKPVTHVPYAVYTPATERLRSVLGWFVVAYAWPDWDGIQRYRRGAAMAAAPATDAVRMITAVLRSERFGEGSIDGAISDGTLPAAVRRVLAWHDEQSTQPA